MNRLPLLNAWIATFLFLGIAGADFPAAADDWRQWRGPLGTGQSDEKNVPESWSREKNVKWRVALDGPGNSSPIVVGQAVYVTHAPKDSPLRGLRAYDRNTGNLLWKHEIEYDGKELTHNTNPYCSASPVSDGERVVAWYGSPGIFCYDLTGKVLWRKDLGKVEHIWGFGSSPLIYDDLVILNFGPGLNAFVVALDKRTGDEVWRKEFPGQRSVKIDEFRGSWSTPVVHREGDRDVLLLALPERLWAVEPRTGKEIWSCGGPSKLFYTSPIMAGDIVIAMCGFTGPAMAVKGGGAGDQTDNTLWTHPKNPQRVGSGVVVDGHIYILNEPGIAWCIDAASGEKKWEKRLPGGVSWSSMNCVAGRLQVGNTAGTTFVLEPDPRECKIVAENKLDETTRASPAYSNGQVFIRTYEALYCIEAPSP
jgi:outer membrane protein assembly factor BamB